jgi:hypothetical protein
MLQAEFLLFCEEKTVDDNGRMSLLNIFETIHSHSFPMSHPHLHAVVKLVPSDKAIIDQSLTIRVTATIGTQQTSRLEGSSHVTIEHGNGLVPELDLSGFVFPRAGDYSIVVSVNNVALITRTLKIRDVADLTEK